MRMVRVRMCKTASYARHRLYAVYYVAISSLTRLQALSQPLLHGTCYTFKQPLVHTVCI